MVNPIDKSIKIMEIELEETLNETGRFKPWKSKDGTPQSFQFLNKELFTGDWKVEISFSGGYGEQWFNVSAYSPKLDYGVNFDTYVAPDFDTDVTEKQYDKEVAGLMEVYLDDIGTELIDKINENEDQN